MKIKEIELSKEEFNDIFDHLIEVFDLETANYTKGHTVTQEMTYDIEYEAKLILFTDSEICEGHENITDRSVSFKIWFYHDGDEIKINDTDLEDRICDYYRI